MSCMLRKLGSGSVAVGEDSCSEPVQRLCFRKVWSPVPFLSAYV